MMDILRVCEPNDFFFFLKTVSLSNFGICLKTKSMIRTLSISQLNNTGNCDYRGPDLEKGVPQDLLFIYGL